MKEIMKKSVLLSLVAILFSGSGFAAVIQTTGVGSAVTAVDAVANFETQAALFDNPYSEGSMLSSRSNLSFNNNSCGFAGCAGHVGFVGFVGNYMYGTGVGGFFEIAADGGNQFTGLEFTTGTGYAQSDNFILWEAYDNSTLVGSGSVELLAGTVIGFSDAAGFDRLRYTAYLDSSVNFSSTDNAPAFDTVRAQFGGVAAVPEPASLALVGLGLAGLGFARRRKAN